MVDALITRKDQEINELDRIKMFTPNKRYMILNIIDPVYRIASNRYSQEAFNRAAIYTSNDHSEDGDTFNNIFEEEDDFHQDVSDVLRIKEGCTISIFNTI